MKKNKNFFILILCMSAVIVTPAFSQSKIIGSALKKVSTQVTKKGAKKTLAKETSRNFRLINSGLRAGAKQIIKAKGYKSFLSYSKNESKQILSRIKPNINRKGINKTYNDKYLKSLGGNFANNSFRRVAAGTLLKNTIPVSANAIKTKWDRIKRGYVPECDARTLSPEAAKRLFAERRKAISPFNQFATKEQLKKYDENLIIRGKDKDANILKNNMFRVMDPNVEKQINAFGGVAAHHVIPGNDPHAKAARDILKKFEIDINGPENGIFLPTDKNSIYKGIIHNTSHSPKYSKLIYQKMKDCKSRDEVIDVLEKIKHDLYNGKLLLKEGVMDINKNL